MENFKHMLQSRIYELRHPVPKKPTPRDIAPQKPLIPTGELKTVTFPVHIPAYMSDAIAEYHIGDRLNALQTVFAADPVSQDYHETSGGARAILSFIYNKRHGRIKSYERVGSYLMTIESSQVPQPIYDYVISNRELLSDSLNCELEPRTLYPVPADLQPLHLKLSLDWYPYKEFSFLRGPLYGQSTMHIGEMDINTGNPKLHEIDEASLDALFLKACDALYNVPKR